MLYKTEGISHYIDVIYNIMSVCRKELYRYKNCWKIQCIQGPLEQVHRIKNTTQTLLQL